MTPVALISGGSSGIGLSIAERLAQTHCVAIAARDHDKLQRARTHILSSRTGAAVSAYQLDVRDDSSVSQCVESVLEEHGRIDVLVNAAGVGGGGKTLDLPHEHWFNIVDTNLNGVYRVTSDVLRRSGMIERKWGRVINIASTGGKQGVIFAAAYSASKHGVVGFTKSLGLELARSGVTVNAVCPGFVETPLAERARQGYANVWNCTVDEAKRRIEERIPLGRYISVDEVSAMVAYVASREADGVVAQALNICGGLGSY